MLTSEFAHLMPKQRTDNFELLFGNNQSIWQIIPNAEGDNSTVSGPGFVMRMAGNNDVTYYNFEIQKELISVKCLKENF
jgi:hypothetical protein